MPSEIVMVLKITGLRLLFLIPLLTDSANILICELQGVTSLHVEAMPT